MVKATAMAEAELQKEEVPAPEPEEAIAIIKTEPKKAAMPIKWPLLRLSPKRK